MGEMNYTENQQKVLRHRDGPLLVLAGPGSGKTAVLVGRIRAMIEEGGIRPEELLVITFTKAAAEEMEHRFHRMTEDRYRNVTFGTMHSVFLNVLQEEGIHLEMLDPTWQMQMLGNAITHLNQTLPEEEKLTAEPEIMNRLLGYISCRKNQADGAKLVADRLGLNEENMDMIYTEYCRNCQMAGRIDFDDMLVKCVDLFETRPQTLRRWQGRYRYLLVDEVQDCNPIQQKLITMLAGESQNLMLVGDDDQSMYRFRGAGPEWLAAFGEHFPGGDLIVLEENFRSGSEIVAHAGRLIAHNQSRVVKNQVSVRTEKGAVDYLCYEDEEEQAIQIVNRIGRLLDAGAEKKECAVLLRSKMEMDLVIRELEHRGIACYAPGHRKSSLETEAERDLIAYIRCAIGEADLSEWLRIINRPYRNIPRELFLTEEIADRLKHRYPGSEILQELKRQMLARQMISPGDMGEKMLERMQKQLQMVSSFRPYAAVLYVRKAVGYDASALKAVRQNPEAFLKELEHFTDCARQADSLSKWAQLELLRLEGTSEAYEAYDAVHVMTYHASKGLEFDYVFLPDVNEGLTPHKRASDEADLEEERRMFYVAMTRARKQLIISWIRQYRKRRIAVSRFVEESR